MSKAADGARAGSNASALLVASLPPALVLMLTVGAPRLSQPLFDTSPGTYGVPLGMLLATAAIAWGTLAGLVFWRTISLRSRIVAVLVFTIPAVVLLLMGPAIVLMLQNLG